MTRRWASLPDELKYLIGPAERYGRRTRSEDERGRLAQEITEQQWKELSDLAERIRTSMHIPMIHRWSRARLKAGDRILDSYDLDCMFALMDELNLDYESIGKGYPPAIAEERVRKYWTLDHSSPWLAGQTRRHLAFAEGRELVLEGVRSASPEHFHDAILALYTFPSEETLDWIESNLPTLDFPPEGAVSRFEQNLAEPISGHWGRVAAVCGISWERVARWLDRGRPLSIVALDALRGCYRYDQICLQESQPKLRSPRPIPEMQQRLTDYANADTDPKVRDVIEKINRKWERIIGSDED